MGDIFVLSLCHAPECQHFPEGNLYTCLVPQLCSCCPGDALWSSGCGGQWGLNSWVPWHCTNGKTVLGWLPPPWHSTDSRLKHIQSLSVKEDYYWLVLEAWRAGISFGTQLGAWGAIQGRKLVGAVFALFPWITMAHQYLTERSSYTLLTPQLLWLHAGNTSKLLSSGCQWDLRLQGV